MDPVSRIVGLLSEEEPRKRIAAAVVLGELGVKAPPVISALAAMAREELSAIAEPAVEALGKLGARSALPVLLEALERKELARAASAAIAAIGSAVPKSFGAVLEGLRGQSWEAVSKVALSVRPAARAASASERKSMAR